MRGTLEIRESCHKDWFPIHFRIRERQSYIEDELPSTRDNSVDDIKQTEDECLKDIVHNIEVACGQCKGLANELRQVSERMTVAEKELMKKQIEKRSQRSDNVLIVTLSAGRCFPYDVYGTTTFHLGNFNDIYQNTDKYYQSEIRLSAILFSR